MATTTPTPKQILVAHCDEYHWNIQNPGRFTYEELGRRHGRDHWHVAQRHYHKGANRGPGQRPPGWATGEDAVPTRERKGA